MSELILEKVNQEKAEQYPIGVKLILLYFLNVVDWFCTQVLIDTGYFREVNPFMIWIMEYPEIGFLVKCVLNLFIISVAIFFCKIFELKQNIYTNIIIYTGIILYSVVIFIHIINFILLFGIVG